MFLPDDLLVCKIPLLYNVGQVYHSNEEQNTKYKIVNLNVI